jgi:hypothetical protein
MSTHQKNHEHGGFEILRTPSGAIDFDAYQIRGRREQAKAVVAAFSWLNERLTRVWRR